MRLFEGRAVVICIGAENNDQPTVEKIIAHWTKNTVISECIFSSQLQLNMQYLMLFR